MTLLKHLAQEFNMDPYKMRQMLRKEFPVDKQAGQYRKWKWEDPKDPELAEIRAFLKKQKGADRA